MSRRVDEPLETDEQIIDAIELALVSGCGQRELLIEISRALHLRHVVATEALEARRVEDADE